MNERHKEGHNGVHCSKLKLATSGISGTTSYLVVPILCKTDTPETPVPWGGVGPSSGMGSPGAWQTWPPNHVVMLRFVGIAIPLNLPLHQTDSQAIMWSPNHVVDF